MSSVFQPSGIITLTTDFGLSDPFVGVMKGRILARFGAARIVDFSHAITPHQVAEAAFWLQRCFEYLPAGTVHVAVVDPGVGTSRDIVAVSLRGHVLIAPDNGLLAPLLTHAADAAVVRLAASKLAILDIGAVSATFHGRDIFAPVAAALAAGRCRAADLGFPAAGLVPAVVAEPLTGDGCVRGLVVTVDHFGNLITNIDARLLRDFRLPQVDAGAQSLALRRTYGDVRPGDYLALINAFDVVEIARAAGSAADGLGLNRGAPVTVRDAT